MNRKKIIIVAVIVLVFLMAPFFLRSMGKYLVYSTKIEKADIAIVLSGGSGNRVRGGVELYKKKIVPKLLMTGGPMFHTSYSVYMAEYAEYLGVPRKNIILEENSCSTKDNAKYSLQICEKLNIKKVIIVTSDFHTRRSYRIYNKYFKPAGIKVMVKPVPTAIDFDNWWKYHEMADKVLIEWGKTVFYFFI
jgi:uncharacterized SAM-binding protein YcdF (DUF218 family)